MRLDAHIVETGRRQLLTCQKNTLRYLVFRLKFGWVGALDKLEAFASFHGPDFYGLPRNTTQITLHRQSWTLPEQLPYGETSLKPLRGGESLAWRMA